LIVALQHHLPALDDRTVSLTKLLPLIEHHCFSFTNDHRDRLAVQLEQRMIVDAGFLAETFQRNVGEVGNRYRPYIERFQIVLDESRASGRVDDRAVLGNPEENLLYPDLSANSGQVAEQASNDYRVDLAKNE